MAVVGIKNQSASQLKFKWMSFRTIYSFIVFLLAIVYAGMTLLITLKNEIEFERMSILICYLGFGPKNWLFSYFICSSNGFLWVNSLWNDLFRNFGNKMAENNAKMGSNWIHIAEVSHSEGKEESGLSSQNACFYRYDEFTR